MNKNKQPRARKMALCRKGSSVKLIMFTDLWNPSEWGRRK